MSGARVDGGRRGRGQHYGRRADQKTTEEFRWTQNDARGLCWTLRFGRSSTGKVHPDKHLRILR